MMKKIWNNIWYKESEVSHFQSTVDNSKIAQNALGECYYTGNEIKQDYNLAAECFKQAAISVHEDGVDRVWKSAEYNLGLCYRKGRGVEQDDRQAVYHFVRAVSCDHPGAQYEIGMYYSGYDRSSRSRGGVSYDPEEATKWFEKAAVQGHKKAQYFLGWQLYERNQSEAITWWEKAAERGYTPAANRLGYHYLEIKNYSLAVGYFRKAINTKTATAEFNIGLCYFKGQGVTHDYFQAAEWFRQAAQKGNGDAQVCLASCYEKGTGVNQDLNLAAKWYKKAAKQENPPQFIAKMWCETATGAEYIQALDDKEELPEPTLPTSGYFQRLVKTTREAIKTSQTYIRFGR